MTPNDLKEYFGTQQQIAKAFGCSQSSVCEWFQKGKVPKLRQFQANCLSHGALSIDKEIEQ